MSRATLEAALRGLIHARNSRGRLRAKTRELIHATCNALRNQRST